MTVAAAPATGAPAATNGVNGAAPGGDVDPKAAAAAVKPEEADPLAPVLKQRPFKVKGKDGKELAFDDPAKIQRMLQKSHGADLAFEDAKTAREEAAQLKQLVASIEADPVRALKHLLGDKWQALAEQEALGNYEKEQKYKGLPPDVRERLERADRLEAEHQTFQQRQQQEQQRQQQTQAQAEQKALEERVLTQGMEACVAAGFPTAPPPAIPMLMGHYLQAAEAMGLGPKEAAAELKDDLSGVFAQMATAYVKAGDGASLVKWLGDDVVKLLRKHDLAALRGGQTGAASPAPRQEQTGTQGMSRRAVDDFFFKR